MEIPEVGSLVQKRGAAKVAAQLLSDPLATIASTYHLAAGGARRGLSRLERGVSKMISLIFIMVMSMMTGSFWAALLLYLPLCPLFMLFDMLVSVFIDVLRDK